MAMTQTRTARAHHQHSGRPGATLPARRPTTPAGVRRTLEEIAFVLQATQRLSASIRADQAASISAN